MRTPVRYRMQTPDHALPEDAQNVNKLAQTLHKFLLHRKGIEQEGPAPQTNNERKIQSQPEHRRKRREGKGKYTKWKTRSTSMKLTFRNRWQSVVLEKTMKITCQSNEQCNMCGLSFFCTVVTMARGVALLSVCPGLLFFLHTVWLLTYPFTCA